MTFMPVLNPLLLAFLLLVPLILFCVVQVRRPYESRRVRVAEISVAVAVFALLFAIGMRPGFYETVDEEMDDDIARDVDVVFVLDTTLSMWADDGGDGKTRMDRAKEDCSNIMRELAGADFAMIRFDDEARMAAPFTKDSETILDLFDIMTHPDSFLSNGTNMSVPKGQLVTFLTEMSTKRTDDIVVFFMTDGETTNKSAGEVSYADVASRISGGAVVGYGTAEGGRMIDDVSGGMVMDPETGKPGVSKIDEERLKRMASEMGLTYVNTSDQSALTSVVKGIADKSGISSDAEHGKKTRFSDVYWMLIPPLMIFLAIEMALVVRRRKTEVDSR